MKQLPIHSGMNRSAMNLYVILYYRLIKLIEKNLSKKLQLKNYTMYLNLNN
jgi:hypothetical protein